MGVPVGNNIMVRLEDQNVRIKVIRKKKQQRFLFQEEKINKEKDHARKTPTGEKVAKERFKGEDELRGQVRIKQELQCSYTLGWGWREVG